MERKSCEAIERTIFEESAEMMSTCISMVDGRQITMKLIIICSVPRLCRVSVHFIPLMAYYTRLDTHVLSLM